MIQSLLKGMVASGVLLSTFTLSPDTVVEIPHMPQVAALPSAVSEKSVSLFFVGDIMLGRNVETLIGEHGVAYPFEQVKRFLSVPDITFGNFEGVIGKEHIHTPSMAFQFSIRNEYLTHLRDVGFDILSLANNHSLDYGVDAFNFTKEICRELVLTCGGHPNTLATSSIAVKEVGKEKIGIIFISTVWKNMDEGALTRFLELLNQKSTFQIAYIHWGDEYELVHNKSQEKLAKMLIDHGIDAVIGHHPHVVQDVALYKGKPIFYSLGNFIFDQYFSGDVEEGLGVSLILNSSFSRYRLTPFRNDIARSQPHTVTESDSTKLLYRILGDISHEEGVDIENGIITVLND